MTTYYRTTKGSKAHSSFYCADYRRRIGLRFGGGVLPIPTGELAAWSGCLACCSAEQIAELAAAGTAEAAPAKCANAGITHPGRIYSACSTCGKEGKVNRSTGRIRAHAAS